MSHTFSLVQLICYQRLGCCAGKSTVCVPVEVIGFLAEDFLENRTENTTHSYIIRFQQAIPVRCWSNHVVWTAFLNRLICWCNSQCWRLWLLSPHLVGAHSEQPRNVHTGALACWLITGWWFFFLAISRPCYSFHLIIPKNSHTLSFTFLSQEHSQLLQAATRAMTTTKT